MNVLEIIIQRKTSDGWPIVVEFNQSGDFLPRRWEGAFQLDESKLAASQLNPHAYGTYLGEALFRDNIRDALKEARALSPEHLRTQLVIEAPELRHWHWETLCGPIGIGGKWQHLAIDQRSLFSLYLPSLTDRRFPAIGRRDLRALTVVANPSEGNKYNLNPFAEADTILGIRQSLGDIPHEILGSIEGVDGKPTLNEICSRLTKQHYTILHIVAHGWFRSRDSETLLYLLDDKGDVKPVTATTFIDRLQNLQGVKGLPHLTFLSTCESAAPEAEREGALGGFGQRLVRELGMPVTVAMTKRVTIATANELASHFYKRLRENGDVVRALVEAGASLADAGDITVPALYERLGGRYLFSDTEERELTNAEIIFGLKRLMALLPDQPGQSGRAPILARELAGYAVQWQGLLMPDVITTAKDRLSLVAQEEWHKAEIAINSLCEEALDIDFRVLALGQEPVPYDARCPFPGLAAFRDEFRAFFFGREALVTKLVKRWQDNNFLAVLGASGSGKSSVVLAGVVPQMQMTFPELKMAYMTPSSDPLARLDAALAPVQEQKHTTMLVVDQFEELFSLCEDVKVRAQFIQQLLDLISEMRLVITMRADFWGDCAPYAALRQIMTKQQELVAPMTTAELRSAMEQQAAAVGLRFEADLSHTILSEVEGEPGAMPLLQHLLKGLWERRHGRWLLTKEYRALGGIKKAIAFTADELYNQLDEGEQTQIRRIFLRLTRPSDEAEGTNLYRDTRQRVELDELIVPGVAPALIRRLIQRLADARLVIQRVAEPSGKTEIEVAHEALILYWLRLREWLAEDREMLRLQAGIRQARKEWEANGNNVGYLIHRGARLELANQLGASLNSQETAYLDACRVQQEEEKQRAENERLSDVSEMGWGVIFPAKGVDPAVLKALRPLLDLRRQQVSAKNPQRYHEFSGPHGYRPGESSNDFLARHGLGPGPIDPDKVPYYLLIVGSPKEIPFNFQYQLDIKCAVGRIHFDDRSAYASYAHSVIMAETKVFSLARKAAIFCPLPEGDMASWMATEDMIQPLLQRLPQIKPDWDIQGVTAQEATKARLTQIIGGSETPTFLFTCSHGMQFVKDDPHQLMYQGALICQDWPGPHKWKGPLTSNLYFAGEDIADNAHLIGLIAFLFAEFGAGTPLKDDFDKEHSQIAPHAFISQLPQRLLGHPLGGALAVIGHVEKAYTLLFRWPEAGRQLGSLEQVIRCLLDGYTVGLAMEPLGQRYAELAASYAAALTAHGESSASNIASGLLTLESAMVDARNWIVLGDPAVRLPLAQASSSAGERPVLDMAIPIHSTWQTPHDDGSEPDDIAF